MNFESSQTDYLIVGAGPTGLALATELRRLGATPLIIDRHPAGANTSRACVVHAATLEELEPSGVTADLLARGLRVPIFRVRDGDRSLLTIDFSDLRTPYPYTLMIPQNRVEDCLEARLEQLGGTVSRGCTLENFEHGRDHVVAQVDGIGSVRARWLIGCDGMHSVVRTNANIPFRGAEYEEDFVLADVRMTWPLSREEVTLFYSPAGLMVVAPLPEDHFRIVATVEQAPANVTADFIQRILKERGPGQEAVSISAVAWSSRFRIHHRLAQSPRSGRVLLCGDAAHVHSPAGGQGMNTGIQDSTSLAKALMANRSDNDHGLLDEWAAERHRVASSVVTLTDRMTKMATVKSPTAQLLRNWAISLVGNIKPVRTAFARTLAELDSS